jgi:hypothetical protein
MSNFHLLFAFFFLKIHGYFNAFTKCDKHNLHLYVPPTNYSIALLLLHNTSSLYESPSCLRTTVKNV